MSQYTEEQLIELITEHAPEALSAEQIAVLRRAMHTSEAVREALAAEVGLEEALATHHAPDARPGGQVVDRLDALLADRHRGWWWRAYGIAVVAMFVLGALATAPYWMPVEQTRRSTPADRGGQAASAGQPRPLPADPGETAAASAEIDARGRSAPDPARPDPEDDAPAPDGPIALDWRHYVDPITVPALRLSAQTIAAGLAPIHGAPIVPKTNDQRAWVEVDGVYQLAEAPHAGRMMRLVLDAARAVTLDLWRGRTGVRLAWEPREHRWTAMPIARERPGDAEPSRRGAVFASSTRARSVGTMPLDVGVADGHVTLSRSGLPLLSVVMEGEPQQMILRYRGRVYLSRGRPAVDLVDVPDAEARIASLLAEGPDEVTGGDERGTDRAKADAARALPAALRCYQRAIASAQSGDVAEAVASLRLPDELWIGGDDATRPMRARATRQVWYTLANSGRWSMLREQVLRHRAMSVHDRGTLPAAEDGDLIALGAWLLGEAMAETGDALAGFDAAYQVHPLSLRADREAESLLAEFQAAIEAQQPGQAARLLVASPLMDTLVAVGEDRDLLRSSHLLVRQALRQSPALREAIREEHEAVGDLRVRRAIAAGDQPTLEALALQFYGSAPGKAAAMHLADRELSLGRFLAAAERYQSLLDLPDAPPDPAMRAKHRLAWAMMGEARGEPIATDVQLGEHRYTPAQFEQFIGTLIAANSASPSEQTPDGRATPRVTPGPITITRRITLDSSIDFGKESRLRFCVARDHAAVMGEEALVLVRLSDGRITRLTRDTPRRKGEAGARIDTDVMPLLLHDGLIGVWRRGDRAELRRVSADGKVLWSAAPDAGVVGDPVRIGRWVYALSDAPGLGGRVQLNINRIDLESGQVARSRPLMAADQPADGWRQARGVATDRGPAWVVASSLVAADATGEVRWVRRLPYIPAHVDRALWQDEAAPALVGQDQTLLAAARGMPGVVAVDLLTGRQQWRAARPQCPRVVGFGPAEAVIRDEQGLTGLDRRTGHRLWTRPATTPTTAATAAPALIEAAVVDQALSLRWLTPGTGQPGQAHRAAAAPGEDRAVLGLYPGDGGLVAFTLDAQRRLALSIITNK